MKHKMIFTVLKHLKFSDRFKNTFTKMMNYEKLYTKSGVFSMF